MREAMEVREDTGAPPLSSQDAENAARQIAALNHQLLGFLLEMHRGMGEFRRSYGLAVDSEAGLVTRESVASDLFRSGGGERIGRLTEMLSRELMVHHAALLEGYHEATQDGSRRILGDLDPETMYREHAGSKIQVGPFQIDCSWRPVMFQVIWEEFIRRFERLKKLAPSDFERFYRDGFRRGYKRFCDRGKNGGETSSA
jgi:hypothetical protein